MLGSSSTSSTLHGRCPLSHGWQPPQLQWLVPPPQGRFSPWEGAAAGAWRGQAPRPYPWIPLPALPSCASPNPTVGALIPPPASARTGPSRPAPPRASPPPPALTRGDHDRLRGSAPSVDGGRLVVGRHGRGREARRKIEGRKKKITGACDRRPPGRSWTGRRGSRGRSPPRRAAAASHARRPWTEPSRLPWQNARKLERRGEEKEEDVRGVLVVSHFDPRWHELVQVGWVPHKQKLTRYRANVIRYNDKNVKAPTTPVGCVSMQSGVCRTVTKVIGWVYSHSAPN
jgi:hypothetical protein